VKFREGADRLVGSPGLAGRWGATGWLKEASCLECVVVRKRERERERNIESGEGELRR
jgi:hypothetical protein